MVWLGCSDMYKNYNFNSFIKKVECFPCIVLCHRIFHIKNIKIDKCLLLEIFLWLMIFYEISGGGDFLRIIAIALFYIKSSYFRLKNKINPKNYFVDFNLFYRWKQLFIYWCPLWKWKKWFIPLQWIWCLCYPRALCYVSFYSLFYQIFRKFNFLFSIFLCVHFLTCRLVVC